MPKVILIIDRDKQWLDTVSRLFTASGYKTHVAENCEDALKLAGQCPPDCILLDQYLAATDSCRFHSLRLQPRYAHAAIVIAAATRRSVEDASYLNMADAILIKEGSLLGIRAMMARMLRRPKWVKNVLHAGDVELCAARNTVKRRFGPACGLSTEQFRLLSLLVESNPDHVPEDVIAMRVFGKPSIAGLRGALRALVHRLRARLGPGLGRRIRNLKGRGWIYVTNRVRPRVPKRPLPAMLSR